MSGWSVCRRYFMLTVVSVLVFLAVGLTILAAIGKCPLFVPVLLLSIVELLRVIPR